MPNNMQLIDYLSMCVAMPIGTPACYSFWETVMYASAAIGILLAGWFTWKMVDHKRKLAAALRAQQEREKVADETTMRQHTWSEPADIAADVTDPHLAKKIRQELEQQRMKNLRP
jgi:hypothetical protein